jgi:nicotinamide mononucleotide adenylyltransferase
MIKFTLLLFISSICIVGSGQKVAETVNLFTANAEETMFDRALHHLYAGSAQDILYR